MSYYFPLGGGALSSVQNISHSLLASTASIAYDPTTVTKVYVLTASYAASSGSTPAAGANGTSITINDCNPALYVQGPTGAQGPTGSKGADITTCPVGTIACTGLNVSLSAAYDDGITRGINYYVPSGSQYSIVCMEIPAGCTSATAVCPSYLPVAFPTIV